MDQRKVFLQSETVSFCLNTPAGPTCTTPDPAEVPQCPRPPRQAGPDGPARPWVCQTDKIQEAPGGAPLVRVPHVHVPRRDTDATRARG
jgi:hypothetical protein